MHTYSHAVLSWAAARRLAPSDPRSALWGALGAVLPDLPAVAGGTLLAVRRGWFTRGEFYGEVCGRRRFRGPDAALHSLLPVSLALALYEATSAYRTDRHRGRALLLGWAGHVLADALTHGGDARPLFWPLSGWRFDSPVSYWDRGRYGGMFSLVEHMAVLAVALRK